MSQFATIVRREYLERVRQRSFILGTVLVPIFMLSVTFLPIWLMSRSTGKPVRLLGVDGTGALSETIGRAFPDSLPDGSRRFVFDWQASPGAGAVESDFRAELEQRVLREEWSGLLWIPADALDGGRAQIYARGLSDPEILARIRDAISRAAMMARLEGAGIAPGDTDRISRTVPLSIFKLSEEGVREGGIEGDFLSSILLAMILYMTVLLYGMSIQRSVLEDKTSRIVEILLASVRPFHLMLGKIIGVGSVGITQYAIWAIFATAGAAYIRASNPALATAAAMSPVTLVFFVVYFVLGYFLYAGVYAGIGAAVTTEQEGQQAQWPITMLLVLPMLFISQVIRDPDGSLTTILSLIPFFSPIVMLIRINIHTPPVWQIALSVALLVGSIVVAAAVAGRIFRVGILMYGKRATLPELIRWIRAA